jgi:hypothetical protein
METQNVEADKNGRYSVILGSASAHGLPADVFVGGEARWLGVQASGQAEQPRSLLLSVPYAVKALDAETLGGKPASAFMAAPASGAAGGAVPHHEGLLEQSNEIVCSSSTACKTGFVPLFSSNGGSAKVADSIMSQSGSTINISGRATVTRSASAPALVSKSSGGNAVSGGVDGITSSGSASGVAGINNGNGTGVTGTGGSYGFYGQSSSGYAIWGEADGSALDGVHGISHNASGSAVAGVHFNGGDGIFGGTYGGGYSGYFNGDVVVVGNLAKGGGSFKIDHQLDPANKYLYHSFVESPDMMNIYNGNVTTDAQGNASVQLPDWFEALNRDFRYQLTVIGQFALAYVSSEISNRQFSIRLTSPT